MKMKTDESFAMICVHIFEGCKETLICNFRKETGNELNDRDQINYIIAS